MFAMRWFSFLYHGVLTLFLLAIAFVAWSSSQSLYLPMLPWSGPALTDWLLGASIVGLILVVLAVRRTAPLLFFLWNLIVLAILSRGYFLGPYYFRGHPEFDMALLLTAGALIAAIGAWFNIAASANHA